LKNYVGTDDWPCRHIRGTSSYACHAKHGIKSHALWEISRYHLTYDITAEVSH